jgi:hypothetical protein
VAAATRGTSLEMAAGSQQGCTLEGQTEAATAQLSSTTEGPRGVGEKGWLVGSQLSENDRSQVAAVVEKNRDVFAFGLGKIGQFKLFEVELKLKSKQPIFERRRKHSVPKWELVDERCRKLEAADIIKECVSDFAANSVMAAKKDPEGNWKLARFCTDLRAITKQTAQDPYGPCRSRRRCWRGWVMQSFTQLLIFGGRSISWW